MSGAQAGTIATGDFNADGKLDLAVVSGSNGLVLLGNGDGTFAAPTTTVLGTSVSRITAADVNNDGTADLLAANTLGTASVLLSNGDGTFAPLRSYYAGDDAMDIKSADLNHDGNRDLLVANQVSTGTVTVLMGHGDGSFDGQRSYLRLLRPLPHGRRRLRPRRQRRRRRRQLLRLELRLDPPRQRRRLAHPDRHLRRRRRAVGIEADDVDGDGYDDLVSSNGAEYQVELNNHDGTLAPVSVFAGSGRDFLAHDFNDDGAADLARRRAAATWP